MKTVWIFGGSFCSGYRYGGGELDWIAQLNADVTVWASAPSSPRSQYLMLDHAFNTHLLERKFQNTPDYIIYDYPPNTRVIKPTELLESEFTMLNFRGYNETDHTHKFECGCEGDQEPYWDIAHLFRYLKKDPKGPKRVEYREHVRQIQRKIINNELPAQEENEFTIKALDRIKESGIPYCWFCPSEDDDIFNFPQIHKHSDAHIDIMTLDGSIPTQEYNSKTFNHLSIQQNLSWAKFFNNRLLDIK